MEEIRREAVRATNDPAGRPLPLAGHWGRGNIATGHNSFWQRDLIAQGHHLLPNLDMPLPTDGVSSGPYEGLVREYAQWNVPITLRGTNWQQALRLGPWGTAPVEQNPLLLKPDGTINSSLADPFGPVEPWNQAGKWLIDQPAIDQVQQWYPNPPKVLFLSNNETMWLKGGDTGSNSKRYLDLYGTGHSHDFKNHVVSLGYTHRLAAMFDGMRQGLDGEAWKSNSSFIGYGAFGPSHYARWSNWKYYSSAGQSVTENDLLGNSITHAATFGHGHRAWDGGSVPYYTHDWDASTDYTVYSPQVEAMNWLMMQKLAYAENPDFWFELSVWDGNSGGTSDKKNTYIAAGQTWSPQRYGGFVQFGMWLTKPRVVREFRGFASNRESFPGYFDAIMDAVDWVYQSPLLERFWRKGELVANANQLHPYQTAELPEFTDEQRWYLLDADVNGPPLLWNEEIPVFALAHLIEDEQGKEWLLYAHSPLADREDVQITVPGFGLVTVDVTVGGAFYHITRSGEIVSVVVVPEPAAGAVLAIVLLFLRERRGHMDRRVPKLLQQKRSGGGGDPSVPLRPLMEHASTGSACSSPARCNGQAVHGRKQTAQNMLSAKWFW